MKLGCDALIRKKFIMMWRENMPISLSAISGLQKQLINGKK